jgi:transcriptional regulator GlxA family with amidase domain
MLQTAAHRAIASWAAERLVSGVGAPFDVLPPELVEAIRFAFVRPDRVRSVEDLAASARTTRRSLDRWLARAGVASARTLLSCARATAAYHLIAVGNVQKRRAAALAGYSSARSLARGLRDVAGLSNPIELDGVSRGKFMVAVRRRLVRESRSRAWGSPLY